MLSTPAHTTPAHHHKSVPAAHAARVNQPAEPLSPHAPKVRAQLIGRTPSGQAPDATASQVILSHDGRISRLAAYTSNANNISAGSDGHDNVYVVRRARPWTQHGSPWQIGSTVLASQGLGGTPANGDSTAPVFGGNDFRSPTCLAYVSSASNLVKGDTDGHADVFIRGINSGKTRRVQTPGAASSVSVDARCRSYAYVSDGSVYARDKNGKTRRQSAVGGVATVQMSYNGKDLVYDRNGQIVFKHVNGGQRVIGAGASPSADEFGRYVTYTNGGNVYAATLSGGRPTLIDHGTGPSMSSGGHFIFYGQGPLLRLNVKKQAISSCPSGDVTHTASSPHGNYAVFSCTDGGVYLAYVGPQGKGS